MWRCFVKYPNAAERGCVPAYSSRATADYNVAGAFDNQTHCVYADSLPHTGERDVPAEQRQDCGVGLDQDKVARWAASEHGVYDDIDREVYLGMGSAAAAPARARRSAIRMQKLLSTNWTASYDLRHRDAANNYTLMTDYVLEDALFYERMFEYYPM